MKARIISTFDPVRRRNKYGNERVEYNGMTFDSKKELSRYKDLELMQRAGLIFGLERQVRFELLPECYPVYKRPLEYIADFTYGTYDQRGILIEVIEDVKSPATRKNPVYKIKKRLMYQLLNYEIVEV